MNSNLVTGIDIGGSHITAALVDLQAHAVVQSSLVRWHINSKAAADQIINEWSEAILSCQARHPDKPKKIGIAMPGPFDYQKGICYIQGLDKYESLYARNVKALFAKSLSIEETDILMMNDASCFLKGEVFGGAVKNCNNVIGITLGTGLGSALFKQGSVHEGFLFCAPYKGGTTEDYISTRWFKKEYEKRTGRQAENVKELSERVSTDETAVGLFAEFGENLGEVLADYSKTHHSEAVVIGGNIIHSWELFMPATNAVLKKHHTGVRLVKAALGEQAALLGAGSLWV